jgi:hypothetical protein
MRSIHAKSPARFSARASAQIFQIALIDTIHVTKSNHFFKIACASCSDPESRPKQQTKMRLTYVTEMMHKTSFSKIVR